LFDGTLGDDAIAREQQAVEQFFKKNAEIENVEAWGRRRLAYEIRRKKTGVYFLFKYKSEGDVTVKFEHEFKLNQNILRYLTVVRDPRNEGRIRPSDPAAIILDDAQEIDSDIDNNGKGE
jgi:small subunit ribosomal protein S6